MALQKKPECILQPLRYLIGLTEPAIKGITKEWKLKECT